MSSALDILLEMGFPRTRAEKALVVTGNEGAEAAMEWLLVHSEDPEIDVPMTTGIATTIDSTEASDQSKLQVEEDDTNKEESPASTTDTSDPQPESSSGILEAKSVKCDELEEKIKQRRFAKEEEARLEQKEKEKSRRRTGQEVLEAKKRLEEEEMKRIADLRRKEKLEEKLARQRVLEQIERDKQARKEKFPSTSSPSLPNSIAQPAQTTTEMAAKKEYTQTRLQVRLTNGQTLTQSFGSKEELAAVRLYIEMNRTDGSGPFTIMTSFPKKVFTEDDMEKPLYQLGLVPSAVLILNRLNIA